MPNKNCPKCKKESHVRTAKCKCGFVFYTPERKTKEELKKEVVKEEKEEKKDWSVKDLSEEAWVQAHKVMGYTVKLIAPNESSLNKKYEIIKLVGNRKANCVVDAKGNTWP